MKEYLTILLTLLIIDGFWLSVVAKKFYQEHLAFVFSEKIQFLPAAVFYLIYPIGILIFSLQPAIASESSMASIWRGALLGLMAYGAYDLTNQATISRWPVLVTIVDISWGIFLTALVSFISYKIIKLI